MKKRRGFRIVAVLLSVLLLSLASLENAAASTTMVTTTAVRLRASASSKSKQKTTIAAGKYVNAIGTKGNWTKVVYYKSSGKSYTGYVYSKYLKYPSSSSGRKATLATAIWIRSGPSVSYRKIGVINAGRTCTITGTSGNWYRVVYNGISGYIKQGYLTDESGNRQVSTAIYMRSSPTAKARAIAVVPANATVYVNRKVSGKNWYFVSYNGRSGYMYGGYFKN